LKKICIEKDLYWKRFVLKKIFSTKKTKSRKTGPLLVVLFEPLETEKRIPQQKEEN
jgi:hypothetical protein